MNVLKTTLSVTAALVLAACGNGGTYQPDLTHAPTVTPKPSAPSANAGGTGGSSSVAANNHAGGGASSGSSATGGNTATTQPPAGSGNAGTTPPSTGNTSGSPATGGSNAGTPPTTPPATGNNLPAPTAGDANANYAKGWVDRLGYYHEKNLPAPVAPASGSLSGDIVSVNKQLNINHSRPDAGNADYERININGVTLSLLPGQREESVEDAIFANRPDVPVRSDKLGLAVGKWLQYASYGVVDMDDEQRYGLSADRRYAFAHGDATANMPTSGKVKYSGYLLGLNKLDKDRPYGLENHLTGLVDLDVDFGSKKVSGKTNRVGGSGLDWSVSADISGNRFAGTSKDGTVTNGGFYGPNAAEVAGTMINTEKREEYPTVFSFGAKKVERTRYNISRPADQQ